MHMNVSRLGVLLALLLTSFHQAHSIIIQFLNFYTYQLYLFRKFKTYIS